MEYTDKAIGFAANLVPLVLDDSKELTYRLGDKYAFLKTGDTINVKDSSTEKVFGRIKIIKVTKTIFKDLPIDIDKHEKYKSKEEQRKVFETFYPGQVQDDSEVIVIEFKLMTKKIIISKNLLFTSKELINYLKTVKKLSKLDEEILATVTYKYAFRKLTNKDVLIGFPYKENKQKELNNRPLLKAEEIGKFIHMYAEENSDIDSLLVDPIDSNHFGLQLLSNSKTANIQLLQIKFLGKGKYKDFNDEKFIQFLKQCLKYQKNEIILIIYAEGSFSIIPQNIVNWLDKNPFPFREVVFIIPNIKTGDMDFFPLKNSYHDLNPLRMSRQEILKEF